MSIIRNEPRLRFKNEFGLDFPDWTNRPFSEIYDFLSTNSFSRDKLNYVGGLVKNIHYGDIHTKFRTQFKVQNELVPYINPEVDIQKLKTTSFVKNGDLVIADASEDYGDIGKSIEIIDNNGEKIVCGLHTIHARKSSDEFIVGFSSFLMNSRRVRKSIMMIAQGTKVLGISSKRLGEINLIFPSQTEQKKISDFLTSVDRRIELLEKKKSLLETYKKGVMKKIFSQEIRFKDDSGNDFPEWTHKNLKDIASVKMGQSPDSKSYNEDQNGLPLIQGNADIFNRRTNPRQWTTSPTKICEVGELILSVRAPVGNVSKSNHRACIGRGVCSISPKIGNNLEFVYQFLLHFESKWKNIEQGSTFTSVNSNDINSLKIIVPSLPEQVKISSFLSSLDNQIENMRSQIEKSKTWKKGLLQKMFL